MVLDGEIGNTAPRIEFVRRDNGLRRANINAFRATAAMIVLRLINRQRQIGINFTEKKHRAGIPRQQQRVFAAPAEAGLARDFDFHDRRAVGKDAIAEGTDRGFDTCREALQPLAHHLVVVAAQCVARDEGAIRTVDDLPAVGGIRRQIVEARRNHAHGARHQFRRTRAFSAVLCHIIHVAMKPRTQPFQEARFCILQIDVGYADALKPQLDAPAADVSGQRGRVNRAAILLR